MNESNLIWVNFNSFPLIKRTFSSWVDFTWLNDSKWCAQTWDVCINSNFINNNNNNNNNNCKNKLGEVSVYRKYNRDQGFTGFESPLLFSAKAECGNRSALKHTSHWNRGKCMETHDLMMIRCPENYEWAVKTGVSIVYLLLKFDKI